MEILPLPSKIYDAAVNIGIDKIELNFSGGSDEGYLNVSTYAEGENIYDEKFVQLVEEWAWNYYDYSGAGCGTDYGDDIVYDLKKKKVFTSDWTMQRVDGKKTSDKLTVD
jgi:hypothetical protein